MSHHRHAVESRLAVEEDDVTIHQVTIDNITDVKNNLLRIHVAETDNAAIGATDRLRTRELQRTVLDELVQLVTIEASDPLRASQVHRNLLRHTQLRDRDVRVRCDNGAGGELHTLALNVVADATLLGP